MGEARQGSRVKILGVARPTIGDYTGQNIGAPEDVPDTAVYLDIDRAKFFNFGVDDVDKAQSVEGLMQALMAEARRGLPRSATGTSPRWRRRRWRLSQSFARLRRPPPPKRRSTTPSSGCGTTT